MMSPNPGAKKSLGSRLCSIFTPKCVTKCHLANGCCNTVAIQCISRNNFAVLDIVMEFFVLIHDLLHNPADHTDLVGARSHTSLFPAFLSSGVITSWIFATSTAKDTSVGGTSISLKGTGHTVFAADGRKSESQLCRICTKQCGERLAPSLRIFCHTTEVFLECKTDLFVITTCCHDSCNRF